VLFPALVPFTKQLETLRDARGLSQRALAARARMSPSRYREIAQAQADPNAIELMQLARALDVAVVDLFDSSPRSSTPDVRTVLQTDLDALVEVHARLGAIIERLVTPDSSPTPRRATRRGARAAKHHR
jgi:transcriptional regulator with XRE-family HTH domain